jgi:hypothetical protein
MECEGSLPCSEVPVLRQINPVYTHPAHFLKIHFNIALPYMPRFSEWSSPVRLSKQNFVYISHLPMLHAHLILHDFIMLIIFGKQYKL